MKVRLRDTEVIAPNFKRRLSGVTSTIIQLIPLQRKQGLKIATLGLGLPDDIARISWGDALSFWRKPANRRFRIWHARRNTEMLAGIVLKHILRVPLGLVFTSASQRNHTRYTKWLIRRMDAVIATSRKTSSYLEVPNTVVMHGIDLERFVPPRDRRQAKHDVGLDPERLHVGCFGRIRKQKGTDLFVQALIPVLKNDIRWQAVIAGRTTAEHASFEKELIAEVDRCGVSEQLLFVGEHSDIERWYKALDLFVAPQRWEGFGLTPLEAMACGVPVVATDVGAFSELVVEGEAGIVLDTLDAREMSEAVSKYTSDDKLRLESGKAARDHVTERFGLSREAEGIRRVYENVWKGA